ncbi:MAG: ATP-binding protein, partial [Endomicrobium sp.]|nr:ATP-binding protein [Endomicrobium sp.]
LNTIKELFKGNKQLFEGLYIYDKWDWSKTYPIIHLDFSVTDYSTPKELKSSLNKFIELTARNNGVMIDEGLLLPMKFADLIKKLREKTGNQVVILVDNYDKPLLDNFNNENIYLEIKKILHNFYQVVKAENINEKFVFLTGVSRFTDLSIFSGLNNLNDISMNYKYLTICGYTQEELENNFLEYIEYICKSLETSYDKVLDTMRMWYGGYSWDGRTFVYNPFSILLFLDKKEFQEYWVKTEISTFLMEQIKKKNNLTYFIKSQKITGNFLRVNVNNNIEIMTLLFQIGYLTIKKKKMEKDGSVQYNLDFPNMEVKVALLGNLMKEYSFRELIEIYEINKKIIKALKERNSNSLQKSLVELFANTFYDLIVKKRLYYHFLFLFALRLGGFEVEGEDIYIDNERISMLLKKGSDIIIIEIKSGKEKPANKMAKEAMKQIKNKKYFEKYILDNNVTLLAVAFGNKREVSCHFQTIS